MELLTLGDVSNKIVNEVVSKVTKYSSIIKVNASDLRLVLAESREKLDELIEAMLPSSSVRTVQPASSISHMYLRDKATIMIIVNEYSKRDEVLRLGELLIALAHAKLHGGPEYYAIKIPSRLVELMELGASEEVVLSILYLIASGVKGFEATRLVVNKGFLKEMELLYMAHLEVSDEERALWRETRYNLVAQAFLTLNTFKALANALPVYYESMNLEFRRKFEENLKLLPTDFKLIVERTLYEVLPREPQDTFTRIENCVESLKEVITAAVM